MGGRVGFEGLAAVMLLLIFGYVAASGPLHTAAVAAGGALG